jgi:hypothetical protein
MEDTLFLPSTVRFAEVVISPAALTILAEYRPASSRADLLIVRTCLNRSSDQFTRDDRSMMRSSFSLQNNNPLN